MPAVAFIWHVDIMQTWSTHHRVSPACASISSVEQRDSIIADGKTEPSFHNVYDGSLPTAAEALDHLDMPLVEAGMTQQAVYRVLSDPVVDAVALKCIELSLRASAGANGQNWEYIVVRQTY